ncbi:hypothetical protein C8J57DRAFT_1312097 [Mycena rebaudengoi]|nr:hypothetical protein C8J57DRAFT_1312097 [Mycena rebaudengoi]
MGSDLHRDIPGSCHDFGLGPNLPDPSQSHLSSIFPSRTLPPWIIFSTVIIYIFRPNCFVLLQGFFMLLRRVWFVVLAAIYWAMVEQA